MSKIAGLKGRSPETYANRRTSGDVQTLANSSAGAVLVQNGGFANLIAPVALPAAGGFRAIITYSGVLESPSVSAVQVQVQIEVGLETYTQLIEVTSTNAPVSFSLVFETEFLGADSPDVFVLGTTTTAGQTVQSVDASVVVILTPT